MARAKGSKNPNAGRPKGSKNKSRQAVIDKLEELDCDPLAGMANIAKLAMESADYQLAGNMYKELAQYQAPKLKSIELSGVDGSAIKTQSTWTVLPVTPINA